MSFKCFFNSHFVFVSQIHISFLQGSSFRFAVITSCPVFDLTEGFSVRRSAEFVIRRKKCSTYKTRGFEIPLLV